MNLKLFKQPLNEPDGSETIRLLFEAPKSELNLPIVEDYYLYVWLTRDGNLKGYQAVVNDELMVLSRNGSDPLYSRIGKKVIERSAVESLETFEQELVKESVLKSENADLPSLIAYVKDSLHHRDIRNRAIDNQDVAFFRKICAELN